MFAGAVGDVELALVGVGAAVGHGHHPAARVAVLGLELVLETLPPDAVPSFTGSLWITALHHEVSNGPGKCDI